MPDILLTGHAPLHNQVIHRRPVKSVAYKLAQRYSERGLSPTVTNYPDYHDYHDYHNLCTSKIALRSRMRPA